MQGNCAQGYCAYEEIINPGLHTAWQCDEESRFIMLYDRFVEQVDNFSISSHMVYQLWEQHLQEAPSIGSLCSSYHAVVAPCGECSTCGKESTTEDDEHANANALIDCTYFFNGACVVKFPQCTGVCSRYCHKNVF